MATAKSKVAANVLPVCCTLGKIQDFNSFCEKYFSSIKLHKNTQQILLALLDASKLILAQY